ncbi:MAG: helix-turn-helix domain-containing protein [Acidobacteriia bacterium]|nr:helix-turn-helix domain-containing protein [Terriglobia bacterium]
MPDYLLNEHLASKLGLSLEELARFESRGLIKSVPKKGRTYYSSQDFYRLKGVLFLMRQRGLSVDEARAKLAPPAASACATNS